MVSFYSEASDIRFREVETFGLRCQFGEIDGITFKLVPLRDTVDFEGYPLHQLGFHVPDVAAVVDLAQRHGGRAEGDIRREGETTHAAVRDPDGNTIELYAGQ
jgi:catechol 2,3-dioxygenase-like lactoylglutathione lyase family enzyme